MNSLIKDCIKDLEDYAASSGIEHRFVGGVSYAGLLNSKTTYSINLEKKTIALKNHNLLQDFRKDGTAKDIDIIVFNSDKEKAQDFQNFIAKLEKKILKENGYVIPISMENAVYPFKGERNWIAQFVTAIEVERESEKAEWKPFLAFEDLRQEISWDSLEAWKVELEDGLTYTTRNPIGDYYAYFFRSPGGIKLKDLSKIGHLKKLADKVDNIGKSSHSSIDYHSFKYYGAWEQYISRLNTCSSWSIRAKSILMRTYWNTIGTYLAHGKGIGKFLGKYATKFTGVKQ